MADLADDDESFILVEDSPKGKKQRTSEQEAPPIKHNYETPACVTFEVNSNPSIKIPLAAHVRMFIEALNRADEAISFLSLDKTKSYYPTNDKFPEDEKKFKEFFLIHPPTRKHPQQVTVGCIIRSTKTIPEIKKTPDDKTPIFTWLKENKVFIAADSIGHHVTRTIGNLLHIHPRITHRDTLRTSIQDAMQTVQIDAKEVIAMAPEAATHYQLAMDSGDDTPTFVPPFEVFPTRISTGTKTNRTYTDTIGIACATHHATLLGELAARLYKNPPRYLSHMKYIPSGIHTVVGEDTYRNMITDNNKFLTTGASIPIEGIDETTLDTSMSLTVGKNKTKEDITLRELFLRTSWCTQVEKTETPGKIIVVTTKGQLHVARQWIDDSIPKLFNIHLPKNPTFTPFQKTLPNRTDRIQTTDAMTTYADALKTQYQQPKEQTTDNNKKFVKPPIHKTPRKYLFDPADFPAINTKKSRSTDTATTSSVTTEQTSNTTTTNTTKQPESLALPPQKFDLEALKNEIRNNIKADLERMISQKIEPLQKQIEPLRTEVRSNQKELTARIDGLADAIKLLSTQMSQLSESFHTSKSTPPTARGDGHS